MASPSPCHWHIPFLVYFLSVLRHFPIHATSCDNPIPTSVLVNPDADIILGVLLPLRDPSPDGAFLQCGPTFSRQAVQVYEALRWSTALLNQDDGEVFGVATTESFVPGVTFGLWAFDSCGHDALAQLHLLRLFPELGAGECGNGTDPERRRPAGTVLGVIDLTDVTTRAEIKTKLRDLHVPTMPLDLHTSIPAEEKAKAMVHLSRKMGWQWAALLYTGDEYSTRGAKALGRLATKEGLCLGLVERVPHSLDPAVAEYKQAMARISTGVPERGGVFVFGRGRAPPTVLDYASSNPAGQNDSGSPQWFFSEPVEGDRSPTTPPILSLLPLPVDVSGFETYWNDLDEGELPETDENRWFKEYSRRDHEECHGGKDVKCSRRTGGRVDRALRNAFALPAVHAAFTLAHSAKRAWRSKCGGVPGACHALREMARREFVESFLENLELVPGEQTVGLGGGRNVVDGKMAPSVRLALSVQRDADIVQVLAYSENGVEVLDNDFVGIPSPCPDSKCKNCIRVRESRDGQNSEADFQTANSSSRAIDFGRSLTFPVLIPLRHSDDTPGVRFGCGTQNNDTSRVLEPIREQLLWARTRDGRVVEPVLLDTCSSTVVATEVLGRYLSGGNADFGDGRPGHVPLAIVSGSAEVVSAVTALVRPLGYAVLNLGEMPASESDGFLHMIPSPGAMAAAFKGLSESLGMHEVAIVHGSLNPQGWEGKVLEAVRADGPCAVLEKLLSTDDSVVDDLASELKEQGLSTVLFVGVEGSLGPLVKNLKASGISGLTIVALGQLGSSDLVEFSGTDYTLIRLGELLPCRERDGLCETDVSRKMSLATIAANIVMRALGQLSFENLVQSDSQGRLLAAIRSVNLEDSEFHFSEDNFGTWAIEALLAKNVDSSMPSFTKIGTYEDGRFVLLPEANVTVGSTDANKTPTRNCINTMVANGSVAAAVVPWRDESGIAIAATFAVHRRGSNRTSCGSLDPEGGVEALEAFLWAVDQVNSQPDVLPGVRLGAVAYDTCGDPLRAAGILTEALGGTGRSLGAFVSASDGEDGSTVLEVVGSASVPLVALRTPAALQSVGASIVSMSSPNSLVAEAILGILDHFGWTFAALIHSEDRPHDGDVASALLREAPSRGVRLSAMGLDPSSEGGDAVQHLARAQRDGARIVLALLNDRQMKFMLEMLNRLEDKEALAGMVWITIGHERIFLEHREIMAGVLSLSFPQARVPKFETYFSGLHPKNNTRNPWFREFWQKTFQCKGASCEDGTFHLGNYPGRPSAGNVPLVIQAVFQAAQAIDNVRRKMCPERTSGLCERIASRPDWRSEFLSAIREIRRKASVQAGDGADEPTGTTEERLEIYGMGEAGNGTHTFIKVGRFANGLLSISDDGSHVRSTEGLLPYSNVRSSCFACGGRDSRRQRISKTVTSKEYFPGSDFGILLLLPIHGRGRNAFHCGPLNSPRPLQEAVAFGSALESLQDARREGSPALGGVVLDYCDEVLQARDRIFSSLASFSSSEAPVVAALVLDDALAPAAAETLAETGIATLSPSAPSGVPTPGVLRPSAGAADRPEAVVALLVRFGWNHVAVLSARGDRGDSLRRDFGAAAAARDVCVAGEFVISGDGLTDAEAMRLLREVRRTAGSRVVVVLSALPNVMHSLLTVAEFTVSSEKLVFVLADHDQVDRFDDFSSHILSLTFDFEHGSDPSERWSSLSPADDRWLPVEWLEELWSLKFGCRVAPADSSLSDVASPPACRGDERLPPATPLPSAGHVQRAVRAVATALTDVIKLDCQEGPFASLDDCAPGTRARFVQRLNATWNEGNGRLAILKYERPSKGRRGHFKKIGTWEAGRLDVPDGDGAAFGERSRAVPAFRCGGRCAEKCRRQMARQASASSDAAPPSAASNFRSIWGLITSALSGLGVLLVVICMVYFSLCIPGTCPLGQMLLFGLLLLYSLNVAFILQPGEVVCGVRRFALGVAYAVVFSAKLVRTVHSWRRLYSGRDTLLPGSKPGARPGLLLLAAVLLAAVQVGLATAWLVFSPPGVVPGDADDPPRCHPAGNFEEELVVSLAYVMLLLALTVFFGALAWGGREEGREPRWVLLSSALTAAVWIAWTVAVTHAPPPYRDPSVVVSNLLSATVALVLLYARKVYAHGKANRPSRCETPTCSSSCCSSTYAAQTIYSPIYRNGRTEGPRGTVSGGSPNGYVTPYRDGRTVTRKNSNKGSRGQVQATDLYPLDVYDTRMSQYSSYDHDSNDRPKASSHFKKNSDDYF